MSDELDQLLNNLNNRLAQADNSVMTTRGTCVGCKKEILGTVITAVEKTYHPECFTCGGCKRALGFFVHDLKFFCESCYEGSFLPKCAYCNKAISGQYTEALGKNFHNDHFFCDNCKSPITESKFFPTDGKALCAKCAGV